MRSYQGRFARFVSLLTIAWLLSSGMVTMAQSTGTIQGTITDESGAALPNAQVTVHSLETGVERTTQTDSLGSYQVAALPVGVYRIEVHAQGVQPAMVSDLTLEVSRTVVQSVQMKVGGAGETISITAEDGMVEITTRTVSQV